ncbi:MAG TPA: L-2-hydroxyglutarate oxidase, partial [Thermoanaerobaculia bacterium]|nr:L-2-hydroxyglutarate oxidase [Thermoanaerobaculia bacterium]
LSFCRSHGLAAETCGKVVVATRKEQLPRLEELAARGRENGLAGLRLLGKDELHDLEPHAAGLAGLHVPETGIVDYARVTEAMARDLAELGGILVLGACLLSVAADGDRWRLVTTAGEISCRFLVACAGLESDRVARLSGVDPGVRIVPFRGEYYELRAGRRSLVRNLIYPVPDPRFPFLGVHFTRRITGGVEAGPNAVLAFRREGYTKTSFSLRDTAATLLWPGFWTLAGPYLATGLGEFWRSWNKSAFVAALRELVPEIEAADLVAGGSGVRAQALGRDGRLVDDFHVVEAPRQIHVLNAPSPAATASLAIGRVVAERAAACFGLAPGGAA